MNIRVKLDRSYDPVGLVGVVGLFFKFLQKVHDRSWSMIGHHKISIGRLSKHIGRKYIPL